MEMIICSGIEDVLDRFSTENLRPIYHVTRSPLVYNEVQNLHKDGSLGVLLLD